MGADGGTAVPGAGSRFINRINRAEVRNSALLQQMAEHSLLFRCLWPLSFHFLKTTRKFLYYLTIYKARTRSLSFADLYILNFTWHLIIYT